MYAHISISTSIYIHIISVPTPIYNIRYTHTFHLHLEKVLINQPVDLGSVECLLFPRIDMCFCAAQFCAWITPRVPSASHSFPGCT